MASVFKQVYRKVEPRHGFLTPLQMIEKMVEASTSWNEDDSEPYMRFLIRLHFNQGWAQAKSDGQIDDGKTSEIFALEFIKREDHVWSLTGIIKSENRKEGYPYANFGLNDGYDGIEIVGRVSHEDETWQDWLS